MNRSDIAATDALELVRLVHEQPRELYRHLASLSRDRLTCMAVALAAGIDENATPGELWGWLDARPNLRRGTPLYKRGAA